MNANQNAPQPGSLLPRVLDPEAPRDLRLAAARGALPLSRVELVTVLVHLTRAGDEELDKLARQTLAGMTTEALADVLGEPGLAPEVLDFYARDEKTPSVLLAMVITNPVATDSTLEHLAESTDSDVLDWLVGNESRLARSPGVAEKLKANSALSRDARRRLKELEQHLLEQPQVVPIRREPSVPPPEFPPEEPSEPEMVEEAPALTLEVPLTLEEQQVEETLRRTPLFKRIVHMTVAEKIQTAVKGNAEERALLIRDPVRLVATTVLKSPKLNENEIETYAKLRTVNDEVLRIIGTNREWVKAYSVAHALVRNPRTPLAVSLGLVKRLSHRDLKSLGLDKNVPEVIRRTAKRTFELYTKPAKKFGKK